MSSCKKGINNFFSLYFTHLHRSPPSKDLHQIWHSRMGRRRNGLYQIFWWSVKGCGFFGGSKIAISHWQSQSPLTQGWRYRAARDNETFTNYQTTGFNLLFNYRLCRFFTVRRTTYNTDFNDLKHTNEYWLVTYLQGNAATELKRKISVK